jgi:hypothetical protein
MREDARSSRYRPERRRQAEFGNNLRLDRGRVAPRTYTYPIERTE